MKNKCENCRFFYMFSGLKRKTTYCGLSDAMIEIEYKHDYRMCGKEPMGQALDNNHPTCLYFEAAE